MGSTDLSALPYPEATEQPYVHLDMKELAVAVDAKLFVQCTSTTRPAHRAGRRIFETDTNLMLVSTGTAWVTYLSQPDTIAVPMLGIWTASMLFATRSAGRVTVEGKVATTGGTVPNGTSLNVGVMPAGFRPGAAAGIAHGVISGQILGAGLPYAPRGSLTVNEDSNLSTAGNLSVYTEALLTTGWVSFGYRL